MITGQDINIVLSGGSNNRDPNSSLGGDPSRTPVSSSINNVFDNISESESETGSVDYRCIYVFNDNQIDSLFNCRLFIDSQVLGGGTVQIGLDVKDDVQTIGIVAEEGITAGSIAMSYEGVEFIFDFDEDLGIWAQNLQDALNAIYLLSETTVALSNPSTGVFNFIITFTGADGGRSHDLIELISNNLLSPGDITINIEKLTVGSPINTIAPEIALDTVPPSGVVFSNTSPVSVLNIGQLRPLDGFPVWLKRTVLSNTAAKQNDNFILRIIGNPF